MYSETRRLHLIEDVLKEKSDTILMKIESLLKGEDKNLKAGKKPNIYDFVGIFSKDETKKMKKAIADTCEIIDENEWK